VELYEEIRREYEHGAGTIKGVARKLGVHRRMVREAVANAVPPARKVPARLRPKLAGAIPFIEAILAGIARRRGSSGTRRIGSGSECSGS
jgi:hypothetical protein